jgi:hypothetical protein
MRPRGWWTLARFPALVLALGAPPCQEPNPAFDHETGGATSDPTTSGGTTSGDPTTTTASPGDSTGQAPTTGEPPGTSTLPPDPTTGDPPGESSSSSGGGNEDPAYPPCMLDEDPPCPRPYDQCYDFLAPDFTVCSQACNGDDDCPRPDGGTAQAVCAGPDDDQCVLDCGGNARCPDGMDCEQFGGGNIRRCVWPG